MEKVFYKNTSIVAFVLRVIGISTLIFSAVFVTLGCITQEAIAIKTEIECIIIIDIIAAIGIKIGFGYRKEKLFSYTDKYLKIEEFEHELSWEEIKEWGIAKKAGEDASSYIKVALKNGKSFMWSDRELMLLDWYKIVSVFNEHCKEKRKAREIIDN